MNAQKMNDGAPFDMTTTFIFYSMSSSPKIAICFVLLTKPSFLKFEREWRSWLEEMDDMVRVFVYCRKSCLPESRWLSQYLVSDLSEHISRPQIYTTLLSEAYNANGGSIEWFCVLGESSLPIMPPAAFLREFSMHSDKSIAGVIYLDKYPVKQWSKILPPAQKRASTIYDRGAVKKAAENGFISRVVSDCDVILSREHALSYIEMAGMYNDGKYDDYNSLYPMPHMQQLFEAELWGHLCIIALILTESFKNKWLNRSVSAVRNRRQVLADGNGNLPPALFGVFPESATAEGTALVRRYYMGIQVPVATQPYEVVAPVLPEYDVDSEVDKSNVRLLFGSAFALFASLITFKIIWSAAENLWQTCAEDDLHHYMS